MIDTLLKERHIGIQESQVLSCLLETKNFIRHCGPQSKNSTSSFLGCGFMVGNNFSYQVSSFILFFLKNYKHEYKRLVLDVMFL